MMNILALGLFITSLTTASIFSPNPKQHQQQPNTIVKEGHRVVVVEYDQDGYQNTKISISPEQQQQQQQQKQNVDSSFLENTKDKIKEASSVFPNIGQGISQHSSPDSSQHYNLHVPNPKELICDAYGKCKHRITNAMSSNKESAKEFGNNVADSVEDVVEKAKDSVEDVVDKAKDYTKGSMEKGKEMGETFKEHVVRNVTEAKKFVTFSRENVESMMSVLNLLGFASGYGMCFWITFVSSYVLSRVMPRQQFAVVQSKIYPVYFRAMAYCLGVALLGHVLGHGMRHKAGGVLQSYNLLASLFTVLVNSLYLEPRANKLMFERMKLEKEEGRGREDITSSRTEEHQNSPDPKKTFANVTAEGTTTESQTQRKEHDDAFRAKIMKLNYKLKKLNSYSSFLNILNLMSLTWHLVYLAQNVHSC